MIYPALVMIGIWGIGAGIIVNLAGLRGIPTELYDAARIDGAGWWASLRHVTAADDVADHLLHADPRRSSTCSSTSSSRWCINNGTGEPGGTTAFFNLYLYKNFFTYQNMAYGATLAWLLFIVTLVVTLRPVPDLAPLGLLRGGALVTWAPRRRSRTSPARPRRARVVASGGAGPGGRATRRGRSR